MNCPFDPANLAATVAGSLCYFGTIAASFAGAFDAAGTYYYRNGPLVRAITAAEIAGFVGDANPITGATQQVRDVENAGNTIRQVNAPPSPLNSLSDFVVVQAGPGGSAGTYFVSCVGDLVVVASISSPTQAQITLSMTGDDPIAGGTRPDSGAQWDFSNRVFCAYNSGTGVFEISLSQADVGGLTVPSTRVSPSAPTGSNDGMNCITVDAPFTTTTSTTTKSGGAAGDPHISTLDGRHYTLMRQGNFKLWGFRGPEFQTPHQLKASANWQLLVHYSGAASFMKGLLLLDKSSAPHQALQMTSEDCTWRRTVQNPLKQTPAWSVWSLDPAEESVERVTLMSLTDEIHKQPVHPTNSAKRVSYLKLSLHTEEGVVTVADLKVICRVGHQVNTRVNMHRLSDMQFVEGQIAPGRQPRQGDEEQHFTETWAELGGSQHAALYLYQSDVTPGAMLASTSCAEEETFKASKVCAKHFSHLNIPETHDAFQDCVFDACRGDAEEVADLAAEMLID